MKRELHIRELINRLARADATSAWRGDLNPTQRAVLSYLARANRYSRSPSHVAEYLGSTRGTVSQTFKSLVQKGYVTEQKAQMDKRTIRFDLTDKGALATEEPNLMSQTMSNMDDQTKCELAASLEKLLLGLLKENGGRAFGICSQCRHFSPRQGGGHCTLLSEDLSPSETSKICHEQDPA
ncbi:MarR family winged helix-turn-helix transcriptional regulator [Tritonibacter scottomollicae]|uniref:MarR family winged helix-turn-helix transcriptional regulator n=1 Tax=Tritonibacter scottomollicae TaxID=483013 RepID=UPI003AA975FD